MSFKSATWKCEWCGKEKVLPAWKVLFRCFLPRFCPVTGECAGWEYPRCKLEYTLAKRIAERAARQTYDEMMQKHYGKNLGWLRGHELVQDISHSEKSIYAGKAVKLKEGQFAW